MRHQQFKLPRGSHLSYSQKPKSHFIFNTFLSVTHTNGKSETKMKIKSNNYQKQTFRDCASSELIIKATSINLNPKQPWNLDLRLTVTQ